MDNVSTHAFAFKPTMALAITERTLWQFPCILSVIAIKRGVLDGAEKGTAHCAVCIDVL